MFWTRVPKSESCDFARTSLKKIQLPTRKNTLSKHQQVLPFGLPQTKKKLNLFIPKKGLAGTTRNHLAKDLDLWTSLIRNSVDFKHQKTSELSILKFLSCESRFSHIIIFQTSTVFKKDLDLGTEQLYPKRIFMPIDLLKTSSNVRFRTCWKFPLTLRSVCKTWGWSWVCLSLGTNVPDALYFTTCLVAIATDLFLVWVLVSSSTIALIIGR